MTAPPAGAFLPGMDNALTLALGLCLGLAPIAGLILMQWILEALDALRRMIRNSRRR